MKRIIVSGIIAISCVGAKAGVLSMTNQVSGAAGDTVITYESGILAAFGIATGGYFDTGYDVNAGLTAATTSGDFTDFINNFNILASDAIGVTGGSGTAGFYFASFDYGMPTTNPPVGAALYSLLGDGATLLTSTQFAVLMSSDSVNADAPLPDDNNITLPTNTTVLFGTTGTAQVDFGSGLVSTPSLALVSAVPVPEPSALLLSLIGTLALLRRKR